MHYSGASASVKQQEFIGTWEKFDFVWRGEDTYCIRNYAHSNFLRAKGESDGYAITTQSYCGSNELWELLLQSTPEYVEIYYDIDASSLLDLDPMVVATQWLDNRNSAVDQTVSFSFTKSITHANTFTHSTGFEVGLTVGVEANIPFVGSTDIEVSTSTSQNWEYGSENSETSEFTAESPLTVPPGKVYKATATVKQTKMTIPYIGYVHFEGTTLTKTVTGTYEGVDYYEMTQTFEDKTDLFA